MIPIFDGHNDVLSRLARLDAATRIAAFAGDGGGGAISVTLARRGGFAGGFFAVWVPSPVDGADWSAAMQTPPYDVPLPAPVSQAMAVHAVDQQIAILGDLERAGHLRLCRDMAAIRAAMAEGAMAAILHIEGAEAIGPDLAMLDRLYSAGLRSLGPVWSRPNDFGHGVPFRYPSNGDIGPGLTPAGIALVQRCDALGILVDVSHLNVAGFDDVARHSGRPLVATHSNAHAVCPHARNLTDDQLATVAASDGMVGLNFAVSFLNADGRRDAARGTDAMLRHLDHLLAHLGEDRVGLGSDYDGALVPDVLRDVGMLDVLRDAMAAHGYGGPLMAKICHANWLRVLDLSWR